VQQDIAMQQDSAMQQDIAMQQDPVVQQDIAMQQDPVMQQNLIESIIDRNEKLLIIKKFIEHNSNLAPQGSAEWLKTRQSIIGGSELSIMTGNNPFTNIGDLVANKCNLREFSGNVATKWGNIFEEITRIIIHMLFLQDIPQNEECIFETGSLEGIIPHHRFSPDGLTALIYRCLHDNQLRALITLLEFKSPLSSIPMNIIPPYYLPQVKAGMCDIEMAEVGLFVNNMFRKCRLDQFGNNKEYNTSFHFSDIKKGVVVQDPLAIGIIGLYQTQEQLNKFIKMRSNNNNYSRAMGSNNSVIDSDIDMDTIEDEQFTLEWKIMHKIIDVGKLNEEDTLTIFQLIAKKNITLKYFLPNVYVDRLKKYIPPDLVCAESNVISYDSYETNPKKFIRTFKKKCKSANYNPVGFIPWKLFIADFILVDKEPLYIYQFVPKIEEVIGIITKLCMIENINDRRLEYKKYFPKHKLN